jgi:hypothetical protein
MDTSNCMRYCTVLSSSLNHTLSKGAYGNHGSWEGYSCYVLLKVGIWCHSVSDCISELAKGNVSFTTARTFATGRLPYFTIKSLTRTKHKSTSGIKKQISVLQRQDPYLGSLLYSLLRCLLSEHNSGRRSGIAAAPTIYIVFCCWRAKTLLFVMWRTSTSRRAH